MSQESVDAMMADGAPATPDNSIKKDSEVWFEDGNIVVIAQNTAFRFHKSVLSLHSPVFRDLFSVPQPSSAGEGADETFDGCSVVRVEQPQFAGCILAHKDTSSGCIFKFGCSRTATSNNWNISYVNVSITPDR